MSFLKEVELVATQAEEAGAELAFSIFLPRADEKWFYRIHKLTDSKDPFEQLQAISAFIDTPEFKAELAAANARIDQRARDEATGAKLAEYKFEITANDLINLTVHSLNDATAFENLLSALAGDKDEEIRKIYQDYQKESALADAITKLIIDSYKATPDVEV